MHSRATGSRQSHRQLHRDLRGQPSRCGQVIRATNVWSSKLHAGPAVQRLAVISAKCDSIFFLLDCWTRSSCTGRTMLKTMKKELQTDEIHMAHRRAVAANSFAARNQLIASRSQSLTRFLLNSVDAQIVCDLQTNAVSRKPNLTPEK